MSIDAAKIAAIEPDRFYELAEVGDLFGRSVRTARRWCKLGRLKHYPHPMDPRRPLVLGSELRTKAAGLLLESIPVKAESEQQREARARADLAEIDRLCGRR